MKDILLSVYHRLLEAYGTQHWWPAKSPFEVITGAILTQAVSWSNVEKAIASLKKAGLMDSTRMQQAPLEQIGRLIRPCIYYNRKAEKLKAFLGFLAERYQGDLSSLLNLPVSSLRKELLSVRGIGEETADAIILYAAGKASFVVDAYTQRVLSRLGLVEEGAARAKIRTFFMTHLPPDVTLYNEYHALLVRHAKERCRGKEPICNGCPLREDCRFLVAGRAAG